MLFFIVLLIIKLISIAEIVLKYNFTHFANSLCYFHAVSYLCLQSRVKHFLTIESVTILSAFPFVNEDSLSNITYYGSFTDVPTAPQEINVTDVFQTSCVVHWKPCKDDGGLPLQHYVVERLDMSVKGL